CRRDRCSCPDPSSGPDCSRPLSGRAARARSATRGSCWARSLTQFGEQGVDAIEAGEDLEAALGGQDQIDLAVGEGAQNVRRPHPGRLDELASVVLALVSVGRARDEEPRVVATGCADRRDPTRELHELTRVDRYTAFLETLARRGDPELVDAERGCDRRVDGIDRAAGKYCRSRRENERRVAPEHEDVELWTVAHEDHGGCIADPLHGGSLRGPVTCPVWTARRMRTRVAGFPVSSACSPASTRRCRTPCAPSSHVKRSKPRGGAGSRRTTWCATRGSGRACALCGCSARS